ncbi:MAG: endonuclease/exonuclease/phosphatase family protein [Actinomycetota bacterium]|nr:endonuclease/exonuclease/phosphatase family protein [Actinomycetota bacterium]
MRVATFNIRHGAHDGKGLRSLVADGAGLRSSVTSLHADIVALQEVDRRVARSWGRDQAAMVAASGSGSTSLFAPARRVLLTGHDGVALVVRGVVRTTRTLALPGRAAPRVALFARVEPPGGLTPVTVVATHLQNRVRHGPAEAPMQLDALLEELTRWPEPWILAGDLNLRPDVVVPALTSAGLTPLRAGHTYPAGAPRIEIDWLAVRGLRASTAGVGDTPARTVQLPVGDHRALVADLEPAAARTDGP